MPSASLIYCPQCCECNLSEENGLYKCAVCGALISLEEKKNIEEKLDAALARGEEANLGKLRNLLKAELNAEYPTPSEILSCCNSILSILPDDPIANIVKAFYRRHNHRKEYQSMLGSVKTRLSDYQKKMVYPYVIGLCELIDAPAVRGFLIAQGDEGKLGEVDLALMQREIEDDLFANVPRDVFICHAHADMEKIKPLLDRLEQDEGYTLWYSERNLPKDTENYKANITKAIENCSVFLVFASSLCMASKDVQWELDVADQLKKTRRIEYRLEDRGNNVRFKHFFDGIQWVDGAHHEDYDLLAERIYSALRQEEPAVVAPAVVAEPPKSEPVIEPKPEPKPELAPEPKPEPKPKPAPKQKPKPEPKPSSNVVPDLSGLGEQINHTVQSALASAGIGSNPQQASQEDMQAYDDFMADFMPTVEKPKPKPKPEPKPQPKPEPDDSEYDIDALMAEVLERATRTTKPRGKAKPAPKPVPGEKKPSPESDFKWKIEPEGAVVVSYLGKSNDVVIPSEYKGRPVIAIGPLAFFGKIAIESVSMPNSILTIGNSAFYKCTALKSISWSTSIKTIGAFAFNSCISLEGVVLPIGNLESIGDLAFHGCSSLTTFMTHLVRPGGYSLGSRAFEMCSSLQRVSTAAMNSIGKEAFNYCHALRELTLYAKGLKHVGPSILNGCSRDIKLIVEGEEKMMAGWDKNWNKSGVLSRFKYKLG